MTTPPVASQTKKKLAASLQHACASSVSEDVRHSMIAEAAFYLAERRGFKGDAESAYRDWLEAERSIDQYLAKSNEDDSDRLQQPG